MLYGSECWKLNQQQEKRLQAFENNCLRRILNINWTQHLEPDNTSNYWATSSHRQDQDPKMEVLGTCCTNERRPSTKIHPPVATNGNAAKGKTKEHTTPNIPEGPSQREYVHTTPLGRRYGGSPFEGRLASIRQCPG